MIIIGCDHNGLQLKTQLMDYLKSKNLQYNDVGAYKLDGLDSFAEYSKLIAKNMQTDKDDRAIAICGSGVGMSIALNRHKGIYAVNGTSTEIVKWARRDNNANGLCFGARMITFDDAKQMLDAFLNSEFAGGKYKARMESLDN